MSDNLIIFFKLLFVVLKFIMYDLRFLWCNEVFHCQVDVNLFLTFLQTFKPNIAECLCDTIPASKQTDKRIHKSVDRTLKFLDKCIEEMESKVNSTVFRLIFFFYIYQ